MSIPNLPIYPSSVTHHKFVFYKSGYFLNEKFTFTHLKIQRTFWYAGTCGGMWSPHLLLSLETSGVSAYQKDTIPCVVKKIKKVFVANEAPWFYLCFSQIRLRNTGGCQKQLCFGRGLWGDSWDQVLPGSVIFVNDANWCGAHVPRKKKGKSHDSSLKGIAFSS